MAGERGFSIMDEHETSGSTPAGMPAETYWGYRRGTTAFLIITLGIGITLFSIGFPNEARIRPYRFYYDCEEYTDTDNFTWTTCQCEPPEYEVYLGLAIVGFIMMLLGGIPLVNLVYQSRKSSDPTEGSGW